MEFVEDCAYENPPTIKSIKKHLFDFELVCKWPDDLLFKRKGVDIDVI